MLCGPVGPKLKTLLPQKMLIPKSCEVKDDENHLILEYQRHEEWGNIKAPIANRFIMSHDIANSALNTLEAFIGKKRFNLPIFSLHLSKNFSIIDYGFLEETIAFKPDLIVVSGFHLLDSQDEGFWQKRIKDAAVSFSRLPQSVPVHLELASMSHCPVMVTIVQQLFPLVNSIGLNEQELTFISKCLGGIHADVTSVKKEDEVGG